MALRWGDVTNGVTKLPSQVHVIVPSLARQPSLCITPCLVDSAGSTGQIVVKHSTCPYHFDQTPRRPERVDVTPTLVRTNQTTKLASHAPSPAPSIQLAGRRFHSGPSLSIIARQLFTVFTRQSPRRRATTSPRRNLIRLFHVFASRCEIEWASNIMHVEIFYGNPTGKAPCGHESSLMFHPLPQKKEMW